MTYYCILLCICYCFSHLIYLTFCHSVLYLFSVSLRRRADARNVRLYYPYWQYTDLFIFQFVSLLCLRSTLRIFQFWIFHFWIFHRCDPMPNLKKFCHSLRHEMVSHLFPFLTSISKLALRLISRLRLVF